MSLQIRQREVSDVTVIDLSGRLWILDLPLRELMTSLLGENKRLFVLNLEGVDYVDSSGLGQLITIWTSIRNKGGQMTVQNPTKRVRRLLDITRLTSVFPIVENEEEAMRQVQKTPYK